jgi:hypothetical protein
VDANVSRLIALGPPGSSDGELELTRDYMTLGRSHSNDLVLKEPSVSRVHAALTVGRDRRVSIQDLGSSYGTTVNGRPVSGRVILRPGDVIAFGGARFQYQDTAPAKESTAALPDQRPVRLRSEEDQGQYEIESQRAGNISNVAGNQYVSHIRQERESFLQAIAATRTKARWLIWIGLFFTLIGVVVAGGTFYQIFTSSFDGPSSDVFRRLGGSYIIGLFTAAGGQILLIIGIVLHVIATSRRKRVEREFPLPRPRGY